MVFRPSAHKQGLKFKDFQRFFYKQGLKITHFDEKMSRIWSENHKQGINFSRSSRTFCHKPGQSFKVREAPPYPNLGRVPPPLPHKNYFWLSITTKKSKIWSHYNIQLLDVWRLLGLLVQAEMTLLFTRISRTLITEMQSTPTVSCYLSRVLLGKPTANTHRIKI